MSRFNEGDEGRDDRCGVEAGGDAVGGVACGGAGGEEGLEEKRDEVALVDTIRASPPRARRGGTAASKSVALEMASRISTP